MRRLGEISVFEISFLAAFIVPIDHYLIIDFIWNDYNLGRMKGFLLTVSKTDLFNPPEQ